MNQLLLTLVLENAAGKVMTIPYRSVLSVSFDSNSMDVTVDTSGKPVVYSFTTSKIAAWQKAWLAWLAGGYKVDSFFNPQGIKW